MPLANLLQLRQSIPFWEPAISTSDALPGPRIRYILERAALRGDGAIERIVGLKDLRCSQLPTPDAHIELPLPKHALIRRIPALIGLRPLRSELLCRRARGGGWVLPLRPTSAAAAAAARLAERRTAMLLTDISCCMYKATSVQVCGHSGGHGHPGGHGLVCGPPGALAVGILKILALRRHCGARGARALFGEDAQAEFLAANLMAATDWLKPMAAMDWGEQDDDDLTWHG